MICHITLNPCRNIPVESPYKLFFDQKHLEWMENPENNYMASSHVKHLFITVDPAGGGHTPSHYAIFSAFYVNVSTQRGKTQVVFVCFPYLDSQILELCLYVGNHHHPKPETSQA